MLEVEFYKIVIYFVFLISGYIQFSAKGFIKAILPFTSIGSNFIGCFLVFYLFIPFLNVLVQNMKEKQHFYLILLSSGVYVILGTLLGSSIVMNYVTWFTVLYFVSSYVRLYSKPMFEKTKTWGSLALISFTVSSLSIIALGYITAHKGILGPYIFMIDSNKILAFATAFCAFMFFKNVNVKYSKFINTVAASAFGVLLIHANSDAMRKWLWQDLLSNVSAYDSDWLVFHALASVICIYMVCTAIDYLRIRFLEKPLFKLWDKHWDKAQSKLLKVESALLNKLGINN